jgi:cytoskeletal protein RodZ
MLRSIGFSEWVKFHFPTLYANIVKDYIGFNQPMVSNREVIHVAMRSPRRKLWKLLIFLTIYFIVISILGYLLVVHI